MKPNLTITKFMPTKQLPSGSALGAYASVPTSVQTSSRNHQSGTTKSQSKFTAPKPKGKLKQGAKGAPLLADEGGTTAKKKI